MPKRRTATALEEPVLLFPAEKIVPQAQKRPAKPHHSGHRQRLRERFLSAGAKALADYELVEMLLFASHPRGDVKPLAKRLIAAFGSLRGVLTAESAELSAIEGLNEASVAALKVAQAVAERLLQQQAKERPVIQSWNALLDYCRTAMAHHRIEHFRVLFLDKKNQLIADEIQQTGTVDHTPLYPREVIKRALELGASAVILAHNHPSGDPTPSKADIEMTRQVIAAGGPLKIAVHDHLVIGEKGHYSFKSHALI